MTDRASLLIVAAALSLGGCSAMDGPVDARSNCHTSDGQFVGGPGCTITYSTSRTVSTTTTTVTTTSPAPDKQDPDDER